MKATSLIATDQFCASRRKSSDYIPENKNFVFGHSLFSFLSSEGAIFITFKGHAWKRMSSSEWSVTNKRGRWKMAKRSNDRR